MILEVKFYVGSFLLDDSKDLKLISIGGGELLEVEGPTLMASAVT